MYAYKCVSYQTGGIRAQNKLAAERRESHERGEGVGEQHEDWCQLAEVDPVAEGAIPAAVSEAVHQGGGMIDDVLRKNQVSKEELNDMLHLLGVLAV